MLQEDQLKNKPSLFLSIAKPMTPINTAWWTLNSMVITPEEAEEDQEKKILKVRISRRTDSSKTILPDLLNLELKATVNLKMKEIKENVKEDKDKEEIEIDKET